MPYYRKETAANNISNVHFSTLTIMCKLIGSFLYGFSPARTHGRI